MISGREIVSVCVCFLSSRHSFKLVVCKRCFAHDFFSSDFLHLLIIINHRDCCLLFQWPASFSLAPRKIVNKRYKFFQTRIFLDCVIIQTSKFIYIKPEINYHNHQHRLIDYQFIQTFCNCDERQ